MAALAAMRLTPVNMELGGSISLSGDDLFEKTDREMCAAMGRYGRDDYHILGRASGEDLAGLQVQHPFYDRVVPVITGEHVTTDAGWNSRRARTRCQQEGDGPSKNYRECRNK